MKISQRLNLVIPIETDSGETVHVHSVPLPVAVFDLFYRVLGAVFHEIYGGGFNYTTGPRIAMNLLRDAAKAQGGDREWSRVENGLLAEIHRGTMILRGSGEQVPFKEACDLGLINQEDRRDVENMLVFFTVTSALMKPAEANFMVGEAGALWGAQGTSLSASGFIDSLKASTAPESSGETAART